MREVDFNDLRTHIENNTYLPEFREVQKRARRRKRRQRLRTLIAVVAIAVPAAAAGDALYRATPSSNTVAITGDGAVVHLALPTEAAQPYTWTLVAADGVDLNHMFGLVDVCSGSSCGMQIASIDPGGANGTTQRIDLFRSRMTDNLTDARVVALNSDTVIVSASVNGGPTQSQMLNLTPPPMKPNPAVATRAVQPGETGDIQLASSMGSLRPLPAQPPLTSPHLAATGSSWWVSGIDPNSAAPTLAVSRDDGVTWSKRPMGLSQIDAPPAMVQQGNALYLLVSANGRMAMQKSTDDGRTWTAIGAASVWPKSSSYGIVTAHDKSLIVWISTSSGTILLHSVDAGATFTPYRNQGSTSGPIVAVPGGYLMLGAKPVLSHDGITWASATIPWLPPR